MPAIVQSHRIWGTRYDSLVDAVSVANSSPNNTNNNTTATNSIFHTQNRDNSTSKISCFQNTPPATDIAPFPLHEDAAKERVHVQPSQYQQPTSNTTPTTERQYCPTHYSNLYSPSSAHSRMPHDASVFVASLPSHLSDSELQTLLTAHLGRHATVKHVKLIRDNRNAVCAFVQVQSAAQATKLIEKCNLSLFMDRQIRCEKARAFRTLLVSWVKEEKLDHSVNFEIPSPQPLRLRRCRGSRFVQVTSGAEALCADPTQLLNYSQPRADDPLSGVGVFFESGLVRNDFESLKRLMEAFGPLEFMMPFDPKVHQSDGGTDLDPSITGATTDINGDDPETFHPQEQLDSSSELSRTLDSTDNEYEGIWAVKWEHRNDAVSAVTALQSVSDLCVRWCHTYGRTASNSSTGGSGLTGGTGYSSNPLTPYQSQSMHRPTTTHRPRMLEPETDQWHNNCGYQHKHYQYHNHTYPYSYNQNSGEGKFDATNRIAGHKSASLPLSFSESDFPPLNGNSNAENSIHSETSEIPRFSADTSSTVDYVDDRTPRKRDVRNRGVWNGERTFSRSNAPSPSPRSHSHSLPPPLSLSNKETQNRAVTSDFTNTMSDQLDFFGGVIPHTPDTPDLEPEMGGAEENASGADMSPLTPGFPAPPHTPRSAYIPHVMLGPEKMKLQTEGLGKINGRIHPVEPGFDLRDLNLAPSHERSNARAQSNPTNINNSSYKQHHHFKPGSTPCDRPNSYDQGRDNDGYVSGRPPSGSPGSPNSTIPSASDRELFVGGLKVESWSEERLREVFGQYGSIEELKFVKPGYNASAYRRAFAFVRYVNSASAQRAIHSQHMCPYDGHMIKVQLRDTYPNSRRSQWNHRGRGRFNQGNGPSVHEQDQAESIRRRSPPQRPAAQDNNQTSKKEDTLAKSPVPKYPCITDPLSQEEEAALQRDIDHGLDQTRKGSDRGSLHTHSPDITVSSPSPLASPSVKSPQGPPRANAVRRSTQSEPDVQSPPLVHNADVLSTYAPSSVESAPASSSYHSHTQFVPNPWMPSYSMCAPALHEYTQTGGSTVSPPQAVPHDGTFPWMGMYRNMMPVPQWFNPPPGVELTSAPLRPTGYIQRGSGIFIPVYPPERLGQYMSTTTTSVGTENTEQKAQSSSSQTDTTTASPIASNTPVGPTTSRMSPTQTTASTAPWTTVNSGTAHCAQPAYPSPMYPMPYIIPPHPMILSNAYPQSQWMSNPPHSVVYPPPTAHAQAYPHNQQVQSHQQQQPVASTASMPVNGYPFYYQQAQVNYPRGAYPAYYADNTNTSQGQVQKSIPVVVGGPQVQAQQQQQQQNSMGQNKYAGNGHRRDFSRPNGGKPIRKGSSFNNGGGGSSPTGNGTGQSSHAKYFGGPIAKVISNTLPVQATASQ